MTFTHYDLKNLSKGKVIEVTLSGNAANVLLLDNNNFQNYKNSRKYECWGGNMTQSISKLPIPRNAHWHVVIDLGGNGGSVKSSVRVL